MYPLSIITLLRGARERPPCRALPRCRCRSSARASRSTTCWSRTASSSRRRACLISAPGGCATKWINEFGYVTIPTLALTGFALCFAFLLLSALASAVSALPLNEVDDERQADATKRQRQQAVPARRPAGEGGVRRRRACLDRGVRSD